jgi:DNA polymerase-1
LPKTFYILDGHAQIYRAYFAPFRDLASPAGEPTKATFVFTQWLINLIERQKPDYLAMVIDSGDESVFRKEIFPEYKANRLARPDDFGPQEQRILQIVRDAGVPVFVKPGFEADDLIATMAHKLCDADWDVVLVSKDKDLRQLLNKCTRMYDMQSDTFVDSASLRAELGYGPEQAVEVQTLIGDSTDNVPGIPGVGPKTAAKLINQYGTADAVLEHLPELTPKMRENFEKFKDRIPMARRLVTLEKNVPFEFDPEKCKFVGLNVEAIAGQLKSLGFTSLLNRIQPASAGSKALAAPRSPIATTAPSLPAKTKPKFVKPDPQGNLFGSPNGAVGENIDRGATGALARGGDNESARDDAVDGATCDGDSTDRSGGADGTDHAASPGGLFGDSAPEPATAVDCTYTLVRTPEQYQTFLAELKSQSRFAFDTETDALGAMRSNLIGMSFSWKHKTGFYVPVRGPSGSELMPAGDVLAALKPILEDPAIAKVGHNIKYDLLVMRCAGIELRGIALDSMVAAFLLDPSRIQYGIDRLALEMLNFRKVPTSDLIGKGGKSISMQRVSLDRVAAYAAEDADIALRLADLLEPRLAEIPALLKLAKELETPLIDVLAEMEFNGIAVDPAILREQSGVLGERIEILRKAIHSAACVEFNIDSPKQLAEVLFNKLKLKVVKKTKTGPSTDVEVLEKLASEHPCPKLILEYRSLVKLKNTYLDNLTDYQNAKTGRIHASFNQTGAATGRLSCSDPNLQNIPIRTDEGRRIRLAFVTGDPAKNVLLTADYSQIELRVLAHFTEEPALLRAFEADEDIHKAVAAEVFGVPLEAVTRDQRGQAKTINFGIIYGVSAFGLARRIEGLTTQAAQQLINAYGKRFPAINRFLEKCVMEAKSQGYVETILGRRRPIPEIDSAILAIRNAGERMAINSVVQGSAADLIKVAMLNIYRRLKLENRPSKLLLQVHDELVFETPADAVEAESAMIREEMTGAMKLKAPLKVEVGWGRNWQEVK